MEIPLDLNSLLLKFFCYVTCFDQGRTVNWILFIQKCVNQDSFDERFSCDNPGLAKLSYVKIFEEQRLRF